MKTKLAIIALLITAPSAFALFGSDKEDTQDNSAQTMLARFDINNSTDLDIDELIAAETSRQEMEKALDPNAEVSDPTEVAKQMLKDHDEDGNKALNIDELKAALK